MSEQDIVVMTELLLKARIEKKEAISDFDLEIVKAALCVIAWPGKTKNYSNKINDYLSKFSGIAENKSLQREFSNSITYKFKRAKTRNDIDFRNIREVFATN